jgi:hypothetical protein
LHRKKNEKQNESQFSANKMSNYKLKKKKKKLTQFYLSHHKGEFLKILSSKEPDMIIFLSSGLRKYQIKSII